MLFLIYWRAHKIATLNANGLSAMMRMPIPTEKILQCGTHSLAAFTAPTMIMPGGGDFNCIMTNTDCTGNMNFSKLQQSFR
jgi:hypothetical protein